MERDWQERGWMTEASSISNLIRKSFLGAGALVSKRAVNRRPERTRQLPTEGRATVCVEELSPPRVPSGGFACCRPLVFGERMNKTQLASNCHTVYKRDGNC